MNSNIKNIISALVLTGLSVTGAFAQMQTTNVTFTIDGNDNESFEIVMMRDLNNSERWMINDDETQWNAPDRTFIGSGGTLQVNSIQYSENPFITFSFDVTDTGTASTFGLSFSTPITLAPGATDVRSFISGGLTDGGSDGVTLSEFSSGTPFLAADVDGTNLRVDLSGLPVDVPAGDPGTSFSFSEGFKSGPSLTSTSILSADIKFGLSGGDDIIAVTGRVDVDAVPEPSTYTLIAALGAASFVFIFRKRK